MENHDFESLDQLLRSKSYADLTSEERDYVNKAVGGELQYANLQQLIHETSLSRESTLNEHVKKDLMRRMKRNNPSFLYQIYHYKIPAYAVAMLLIILVTGFMTFGPARVITEVKTKTIALPVKVDTLWVQLPPDTIVIEKIIKTEALTTLRTSTTDEPQKAVKGNSMADQKVLHDFLVSTR